MSFEIEIIKSIQSISNSFLDILAKFFTVFGESYIIIIVVAFIYFVIDKKIGERLCFILFASTCVNNSIKGLVKAPRPYQVNNSISGKKVDTATGFSFPSGHTQQASSLYFSIAINFKKKIIYFIALLIILLVAFTRLYLGVHFLRDVLVGFVIGISLSYLLNYLYIKIQDNSKLRILVYLILLALFLPFIFIFYKKDYEALRVYRDFYISYALLVGGTVSFFIEHKYINFNFNKPLKIKLLRFGIAVIFLALTYFVLKLIFPKTSIFFDMFRYFLVVFMSLCLYPLTFKKTIFFN